MLVRTSAESRLLLAMLSEQGMTLSLMSFVLKVRESFLWKVIISKARLNDHQYQVLEGLLECSDEERTLERFDGYDSGL
jgi:hypothetical protein